MSIFTSVGVENLQLRNGSTGFNKLDRFFNTVAEADAAVAGGSYTPDPTVTNGVLIADVGFAIYNFDTNTFDAVAFNQLTAETVIAAKINESTAALVATIGQASDGLISEKGLRIAGDSALSTRLDALEADDTTQTALDAETAARTSADTTLQGNIDAEATTRGNADTTLQDNIDAEATARSDADDVLTSAVLTEATTRASEDAALDARLETLEVNVPLLTAQVSGDTSALQAVDSALSVRIAALEADPTTATALTAAISTEVSDRNTAISTAVNNLVDGAPGLLDTLNEIAAAVGDDGDFVTTVANNLATASGHICAKISAASGELRTDLNSEISTTNTEVAAIIVRLDTAEAKTSYTDPTTQTLLDAETTARTSADTTLQSNIDAEATSRTNADTTLQSNIDAEATSRTSADTTLQTNITNEAAARLSADNALDTRATDVETILGTRTATQLGYLDATSSIQTQLDARPTEATVALLIAAAADDLQAQLDDIDTRLTNAGF